MAIVSHDAGCPAAFDTEYTRQPAFSGRHGVRAQKPRQARDPH
jgi:hypothetical protein